MIPLWLALAFGQEAVGPRPEGTVVALDDGRTAMPAPLALWYEQRHRYAGQLEAHVHTLEGRLAFAREQRAIDALRQQAQQAHLASLQQQVQRAEQARRWQPARDVALVVLGGAAVVAGGWALGRSPTSHE